DPSDFTSSIYPARSSSDLIIGCLMFYLACRAKKGRRINSSDLVFLISKLTCNVTLNTLLLFHGSEFWEETVPSSTGVALFGFELMGRADVLSHVTFRSRMQ